MQPILRWIDFIDPHKPIILSIGEEKQKRQCQFWEFRGDCLFRVPPPIKGNAINAIVGAIGTIGSWHQWRQR